MTSNPSPALVVSLGVKQLKTPREKKYEWESI